MTHACATMALAAILAGSAVSAQTPADPPAVVLPPRVGIGPEAPYRLTLSDAIRMTLERNNDIRIARLGADESRQGILVAEGAFDTRLAPLFTFQRTVTPSASAIGGGGAAGRFEQTTVGGALELARRTPWGGRFTVDFTSSRVETGNQFARLNPQFPASFGGSYAQPLLRGRRIDADRRNILLARRTADLNDAQLAHVLMDQITLLEEAYWDVAFAARNLEVQTAAIAQAERQVASNERQAREGTLAPISVIEAQIQVSNFRQSAASAQLALTQAENRLKTLMLADRSEDLWSRALEPTELSDSVPPELRLEEAVQLALTRRPELAALESIRAQNQIQRDFFADQARPQVDVVGTYSLAGLAGTGLATTTDPIVGGSDAALLARLNELSVLAGLPVVAPPGSSTAPVPEFLLGSYGSSVGNILARRFPAAFVQLQVDLPLRNRAARGNVARAEIAATRLGRERAQVEQAIEADVRNTLQAVASSRQRLDAAASALRNSAEQYESERRRFESGISTVFLVLERQTALVTAQAQELRARADLNQAIALLDRATGATLERHGISLGGLPATSP